MIDGINHITLAVSDIKKSLSFYKDALGLTCVHQWDKGAYLLAGAFWIALNVEDVSQLSPKTDYTHLAFDLPRDKFDAMVARLESAGVSPFKDNSSPGESFYFTDPDGHKLEIHHNTLVDRLSTIHGISRSTAADAEVLTRIACEAEAHWGFSQEYMAHFRDCYTVTSAYIREHPTYHHKGENGIDGFYGCSIPSEENAILDYLYVSPEAMGNGIGRKLFNHMVAVLADLRIRRIEWVTSPEAGEFYLRMGAKQEGQMESLVEKGRVVPKFIFEIY